MKTNLLIPRIHLVGFLAAYLFCLPARAALEVRIVAPNASADTEGNSRETFPFSAINPIRYQQVFNASEFSAINQGGGWISAIEFRGDILEQNQAMIIKIPSLQVNLSTTTKTPDGLSMNFADNVGIDNKIVFGPAPIDWIGAYAGPSGFTMGLGFRTPFFYNPSAGNLLLDIQNLSGATDGSADLLDAVSTPGDSVSSIWGPVNGTTGSPRESVGLVVRFNIEAIPEPSSTALFALGGLLVGWTCYRNRRAGGTVNRDLKR